jgi:hypothetical protein
MNNKNLHEVVYRDLLCKMRLGNSLMYYHEEVKERTNWSSILQMRLRDKYEQS